MNTAAHSGIKPTFWVWLSLAWILIIAKCLAVPIVINHWHVPIAASWVVLPTLVLAIVATILVLSRYHFGEPRS